MSFLEEAERLNLPEEEIARILKEEGKQGTYKYPGLPRDGYNWHLQQKCYLATGKRPISVSRDFYTTLLTFEPPLTQSEQKSLDEVFVDLEKACEPPDPLGDVAIIVDLSERINEVVSDMGFPKATMWFTKSSNELKKRDQVEIHFPRALSLEEREKVITTYKNLLGWK